MRKLIIDWSFFLFTIVRLLIKPKLNFALTKLLFANNTVFDAVIF